MFFRRARTARPKTVEAVNREVAEKINLALSTLDDGIRQLREAKQKATRISQTASLLSPEGK